MKFEQNNFLNKGSKYHHVSFDCDKQKEVKITNKADTVSLLSTTANCDLQKHIALENMQLEIHVL